MNAADVRAALHKRWPDDQYVVVEEAALDPSRMGRKIDLLALSCWRSRGWTVDAVEIKVSANDWRRERDAPAKADGWWRHSDRFWLAAPAPLAARIESELPDGWGLLSVTPTKATALVDAPRHARTDWPWPLTIAVLRSCVGASVLALQRAENRGRDQGRQEADSRDAREPTRVALRQLEEQVAAAEAATGVPIAHWPDRAMFGLVRRDAILETLSRVVRDERLAYEAREALHEGERRLVRLLDQTREALDEETAMRSERPET